MVISQKFYDTVETEMVLYGNKVYEVVIPLVDNMTVLKSEDGLSLQPADNTCFMLYENIYHSDYEVDKTYTYKSEQYVTVKKKEKVYENTADYPDTMVLLIPLSNLGKSDAVYVTYVHNLKMGEKFCTISDYKKYGRYIPLTVTAGLINTALIIPLKEKS